jgi:hypothetical protein
MRLVYLDTNVYNALANRLSHAEVTRIPATLERLGLGVLISPVNVLEILSLGETPRKEQLVWLAQHLAAPPILPEVESIIINYAARIVGDERVEHLRLRRPTARPPLRDEWEKVYSDRHRTLGISAENIRALGMMKKLNALHHAITSRGLFDGDEWRYSLIGVPRDDLLNVIEDATANLRKIPVPTNRSPFYQQNVAIITAAVLCVGVTPFPEPIDEFWAALGLHTSNDRLNFVFEKYPDLYMNGPMVGLFDLASWQSQRKYDRGNFFDGFHLQYLQLVSEVLTNDRALLDYSAACPAGSRFRENVHPGHNFVETLVAAVRDQTCA